MAQLTFMNGASAEDLPEESSRYEFLAGAAFARDQHSRLSSRGLPRSLPRFLHGSAASSNSNPLSSTLVAKVIDPNQLSESSAF
jgi:hypothetical protein